MNRVKYKSANPIGNTASGDDGGFTEDKKLEEFVNNPLKFWMLLLNSIGAAAHLLGVILTLTLGRRDLRLRLFKTSPVNSGNATHPILAREVVREGAVYPVSILATFFGLSLAFHLVIVVLLTLQIYVNPTKKYFNVYMRALYLNIGPWVSPLTLERFISYTNVSIPTRLCLALVRVSVFREPHDLHNGNTAWYTRRACPDSASGAYGYDYFVWMDNGDSFNGLH
jgi:hypothetical protein